MIRDKQQLTKTSHVLLYLLAAKEVVSVLAAYPSLSRALYPGVSRYYADKRLDKTLRRLIAQGWIRTVGKETKKIMVLTQKGELEALFAKAKLKHIATVWDKQWRVVVFDIPEGARDIRARLRRLLKSFGFYCLQASVYIYPYPLHRDMLTLLEHSGLSRYIRVIRGEFDNDSDFKKIFKI